MGGFRFIYACAVCKLEDESARRSHNWTATSKLTSEEFKAQYVIEGKKTPAAGTYIYLSGSSEYASKTNLVYAVDKVTKAKAKAEKKKQKKKKKDTEKTKKRAGKNEKETQPAYKRRKRFSESSSSSKK